MYLYGDLDPHLTFHPKVGGWVGSSKPHVLLVSKSTAPRAVSLLLLISLMCVCVRACALASVPQLHDTDTRHAAGAEERCLISALLKSTVAGSGVRDAEAALRGTPPRCLLLLPATVPQRLVSRLFTGHLTALHRRNHQDYVSIMLAARCLLFAAVCTGNEIFYFNRLSLSRVTEIRPLLAQG